MDNVSKGYTDSEKIGKADKQQPTGRGQTGDDKGQRPTQTSTSVKTDKGSFKFKG